MELREHVTASFALLAITCAAHADPINADQHPLEIGANVATKAVDITRGAVDAVSDTVGKMSGAAAKRFDEASLIGKQRAEEASLCDTAKSDLEILERERTEKAAELGRGKQSVSPSEAAARILQPTYSAGKKVSAAEYVYDIDQTMSDILAACDVR